MVNELLKVSYQNSDTAINLLNDTSQKFDRIIERNGKSKSEFFILESGKRINMDISGRTYRVGDYIVFKTPNSVDVYKIIQFVPNTHLLAKIKRENKLSVDK